ncbi:MAG: hypothetical protein ACK5MK_13695, partial [Dysgonomonas sp.]
MEHFFCRQNILLLLLFFVVSFLFVLFFSISTSPLYDSLGYDSGIFMLVGKAIAAGRLLYVDIFDHKGPAFFFFEALMMKLGGVYVVFSFQIINLTILLYLISKIYGLFFTTKSFLFIPVAAILLYLTNTFGEGNLTEEYSVTLLLVCLYLGLRYSKSEKTQHPATYMFVYGVVFALLALTRMTNSAGLCGLVTAIGVYLLIEKEWRNVLYNILAFVLGIIFVCLPFCVYFIYNDAFDEMIYATFTFNFKYASTFSNSFVGSVKDLIYQIRIWSPNIFTILSVIIYTYYSGKQKNVRLALIVICSSLFTAYALNMGLRTE